MIQLISLKSSHLGPKILPKLIDVPNPLMSGCGTKDCKNFKLRKESLGIFHFGREEKSSQKLFTKECQS